MEFIFTGLDEDLSIINTSLFDPFCSISSTNVFHFVHSGHLPNHLDVSYPHSWHTYFVFIFAIYKSPLIYYCLFNFNISIVYYVNYYKIKNFASLISPTMYPCSHYGYIRCSKMSFFTFVNLLILLIFIYYL